MARVAFLIPIRPGKRGDYLQFVRNLSVESLAPLYRQYGVTAHAAFVAEDLIVSYYEAEDPEQVRAMWALPEVQQVVRAQMSSLVELDPLSLGFLEIAFEWQAAGARASGGGQD
jgi:hypothetical protein